MLLFMRDVDHRNRIRQLMLTAAALLGLAILAATVATAGAHAAEANATNADLSASDRADLTRVDNYLSGLTNLQGNFLQVGPDGSLAQGNFYLRRPGRMRFQYDPPEKLLVVADGTWVAVKDGFSAAQRYPLGSTPLGILLDDHVDLAKEVKVLAVERQPGALRITLADKNDNAPAISPSFSTHPISSSANGSSPTHKAFRRPSRCATSSPASVPTMRSSSSRPISARAWASTDIPRSCPEKRPLY